MIDAASRHLLERWVYVLVLTGGEFVPPYTAARQAALRASGEYEADFFPFLERFLTTVATPEAREGNYFPGGWYRMLKAQGRDPAQVEIDLKTLGVFFGEDVHVSPEGRWRVGHRPVTGRVLEFFMQHLRFDVELGRYYVRYTNVNYPETRYLHHESPPFRVRAVDFRADVPTLTLNDGTSEPLRPETIRMNRQETLFCGVKDGQLPAVFEDAPRFQVMDRLELDRVALVLRLPNAVHALAVDAPWPGLDALPK
ncbi:MAG TPA: hypothetical protein VF678_06065 [bacterium]